MTIDQALDEAAKLSDAGRMAEAERLLLEILARQPNQVIALHLLAKIVGRGGRLPRAMELLNRAIRLNPRDAELHYHLGVVLGLAGDYPNALAAYDAAIDLNPGFAEARSNRAMTRLLLGDFERGWPEYEFRRRSRFADRPPEFPQPQWDGRPLNGQTIFLTAEQGLGDTLQFVRYAELVAARGGRVLLAVQPPLSRLVENLAGVDRQVNAGETLPTFDCHCSLLSLPLMLGTRPDTIPAKIPYIRPDPLITDRWAARLGPRDRRLRVGLVWAGSPGNNNDLNRSMPATRFAALPSVPNVQFYSLQVGPAAAHAGAGPTGMLDLTADLSDFAETAGLIAQLDLVISVDTAVVHLAGAMGKKVWALLPFSPDWRWMLNRTDSPWYSTLRLYRQRFPGDWDGVTREIEDELGKMKDQ